MTQADVRVTQAAQVDVRAAQGVMRESLQEQEGFMKVLIDAESKQILGATVLGVGGDEVIHSLLDVMYAKAPYTVVSRAMHIHPTVSELIPTMLQTEAAHMKRGSNL